MKLVFFVALLTIFQFVISTDSPTSLPSSQPSTMPSNRPSGQPSSRPSNRPSGQPSSRPSGQPSSRPSNRPSSQPSSQPSQPSSQPSSLPSSKPSSQPSAVPSSQPSSRPTMQPSGSPTSMPTGWPSAQPTSQPSCPSSMPSSAPSNQPTGLPSGKPSTQPSSRPSSLPTGQPSRQPTNQPSSRPTVQPTISVGYPAISSKWSSNTSNYWCKDSFRGDGNAYQRIFGGMVVNGSAPISSATIRVIPYLRGQDFLAFLDNNFGIDVTADFNEITGKFTISTVKNAARDDAGWASLLNNVAYKLSILEQTAISCYSYTNGLYNRIFRVQLRDAGGKYSNTFSTRLRVKTAAVTFTDTMSPRAVVKDTSYNYLIRVDVSPNYLGHPENRTEVYFNT